MSVAISPAAAGAQEPGLATKIGLRVGFLLMLAVLWHFASLIPSIPDYLLPGPMDVLRTLWSMTADGSIIRSIGASMARILVGYGISAVGGIVLGVLIARSWILKQTVGTLILSLQSLPSICWLPFALMWVGLNENAILMVIILGALFSIALSTESAVRNIPPIYVKVGLTLGAKRLTLAKDILLFASLPELIGGLKVGWTFAWRSLMAAELIRQDVIGVARLLDTGRQFNDMSMMMASILVILAIGLTVDLLVFSKVERTVRRRWGLER